MILAHNLDLDISNPDSGFCDRMLGSSNSLRAV